MSKGSELIAVIQSGQESKAIDLLHSMDASEWLSVDNEDSNDLALIDRGNLQGFNALQIACQRGHLTITMELLSFGARLDIPCTSTNQDYSGNLALHFAALCNNKYIIEYLMLRGADPSVPNKKGSIALDLTNDKFCQKILQRDKNTLIKTMLSPMDKSRISMMSSSGGNTTFLENQDGDAESIVRRLSDMNIAESPVEKSFEQSSKADSPGKYVGSEFVPTLDLTKVKQVDDNNSSGFNSPNAIGVTSSTSSGSDSIRSTPNRFQDIKIPHRKGSSGSSKSSNGNTPNSNNTPNTPKGSSMKSSRQRSVSSYEPPVYHYSTASSTARIRSNSALIPFQHFPENSKTPPPPPNFSSPILDKGNSGGDKSMFVGGNYHSAGLNFDEDTNIDPDKEEMENLVLQAALETNSTDIDQDVNRDAITAIFNVCSTLVLQKNETEEQREKGRLNMENKLKVIRGYLEKQPELVMCRFSTFGHSNARDGQTPLHVAAAHNNVAIMKLFLKVPNVSLWVRDLQGRTPLHCAVDTDNLKKSDVLNTDTTEMCRLLKTHMAKERNQDPVGRHAPLDITGRTPLGRYDGFRTAKDKATIPSQELIDILYEDGDRSVLPFAPCHQRSGHSPMKPTLVTGKKEKGNDGTIMYAFSEASGWKPYMEDRVIAHCPLSPDFLDRDDFEESGESGISEMDLSRSLFGVCDGHNGSFCAQYIKDHLAEYMLGQLPSIDENNEQHLRNMMYNACQEMDHQLEIHEHMALDIAANQYGQEYNEETGQPIKKPMGVDDSGSTGVFCFINEKNIAIANVGDSRAIVAKFKTDPSQQNKQKAITSPFQMLDSRKNEIIPEFVTIDHGLQSTSETKRVTEAGGIIKDERIYILENSDSVNFTRSFGDFSFKKNNRKGKNEQVVTGEADVTILKRDARDAFVVLACDGVTNVMTNEEIVSFLAKEIGFVQLYTKTEVDENGNTKEIQIEGDAQFPRVDNERIAIACDKLLKECLQRRSSDNMSVVVVVLQ